MREWERRHPGRVENVFSSLTRVTPSHLLDRTLHDFASVAATGTPDPDGDLGFDPNPTLQSVASVVEFGSFTKEDVL